MPLQTLTRRSPSADSDSGSSGQLDKIEVGLGENPAAPDNYTNVWVIGDSLAWTTLETGRKALFLGLHFDLREAEKIIALGSTVVLGRIQFAQWASGGGPQCKLILRFAQSGTVSWM